MDQSSVTKETIFVTNEAGEKLTDLEFTFHNDATMLKVYNPHSYDDGEYTLHLSDDIQDDNGTYLKTAIETNFIINQAPFLLGRSANELVNWLNEGKTLKQIMRIEGPELQGETSTSVSYETSKYGYGACLLDYCNSDTVALNYHFKNGKLNSVNWRFDIPISYSFPTLQSYFEIIGTMAREEFGSFDLKKIDPYMHEVFDAEYKNKKVRLEFDVKEREINLSIGESFEEIEDEIVEEEPDYDDDGVLFPE